MGFLKRLARRAGIATVPDAETWQCGDLAECINPGPWFRDGVVPHSFGPALGDVHVVSYVAILPKPDLGCPAWLGFDRWPLRGFSSSAFRKTTPRLDAAIRSEPEFIALVGRPASSRAPEKVEP